MCSNSDSSSRYGSPTSHPVSASDASSRRALVDPGMLSMSLRLVFTKKRAELWHPDPLYSSFTVGVLCFAAPSIITHSRSFLSSCTHSFPRDLPVFVCDRIQLERTNRLEYKVKPALSLRDSSTNREPWSLVLTVLYGSPLLFESTLQVLMCVLLISFTRIHAHRHDLVLADVLYAMWHSISQRFVNLPVPPLLAAIHILSALERVHRPEDML
jgi:hypothetical protein